MEHSTEHDAEAAGADGGAKRHAANIVLIGPSASGKTTLARALEDLGVRRIRSYTTRPRRPQEGTRADYEFVSDWEFESLRQSRSMSVVREYRVASGDVWKYGVSLRDFDDGISPADTVCILDAEGYMELRSIVPRVFGVLLDVPEDVRERRIIARGDDREESRRRLHADEKAFSWITEHAADACSMVIREVESPDDEARGILERVRSIS